MNIDAKALERWLRKQNYSATTIYQTLIDLGTIERAAESGGLSSSVVYSARRIRKYATAAGVELDQRHINAAQQQASSRVVGRKLPQVSFDPADWQALRAHLSRSELLEDHILHFAMLTGLRAGDALRIVPGTLDEAVSGAVPALSVTVKGGKLRKLLLAPETVKEAAERLRDALAATDRLHVGSLADALVSDSKQQHPYRAAYQRVLRRLKALGDALQTDGRLHTHRLRRTAAVAALRSGVDLATVQQLLGHASLATTSKYLDEERSEDVANAMERFHKQIGGK